MTSLIICFESLIDKQYIKRLIRDYWPKLELDFRGDPKIPNRHDWENRIIQEDKWIGYATIFEAGGDTWLFDYPRSLENSPCLYFTIDATDEYIPKEEDIKHLLDWPRYLIRNKGIKDIRYLCIDYYYQYYRSLNELSRALLSMRIYAQAEKPAGYSTNWNNKKPISEDYYQRQKEFKRIAEQFLESEIANNYFFIEMIRDGIFITNNDIAIMEGFREDNHRVEDYKLIDIYVKFEKEFLKG